MLGQTLRRSDDQDRYLQAGKKVRMQIQVSRSFWRQRSHLQPFCQNPPAPDTHMIIEDDQGTSFLVSFQLLWDGKQVTSAIA